MQVSLNMLLNEIGTYFWALVRITAMITAAPMLSARSVPVKVKLGLALAITILVAPLIPDAPVVEPLSATAFLITAQQIFIGVAMGMALQMIVAMFVIGGQIIAYQMGIGFSQMVDPQSGMQVPVVSQMYIILLTLFFFTLNGHLTLIQVLVDSFSSLPISPNGISLDGIWSMLSWGSNMYSGGLQIALPAIASILLINLTFGVVTRSAPQFNIFSIGFPITMVMGYFIMMVTFPTVVPQLIKRLTEIFQLIQQMVAL